MNTTYILPLRDPNQQGATEHVDAVMDELAERSLPFVTTLAPQNYVKASQGETSLESLKENLTAIKKKMSDGDRLVIVSGIYGASKAEGDQTVLEIAQQIVGKEQTKIVLSTHSADDGNVVDLFAKGVIDRLALPAHVLHKKALTPETAAKIQSRPGALIRMAGVPHQASFDLLSQKKREWDLAADRVGATPLPRVASNECRVMVVLPGDVTEGENAIRFYTPKDARTLAQNVTENFLMQPGKPTTLIVSNGPRTGKYNQAAIEAAGYDAFHPGEQRFQNTERFKKPETNEVVGSFLETIRELAPHVAVVDMTIASGRPQQAFFAGYASLNESANRGGEAVLLIDGASTTMLTQADDICHPYVKKVAIETPAAFPVHKIGLQWAMNTGKARILRQNGEINRRKKPEGAEPEKKAAVRIAEKIIWLCKTQPKGKGIRPATKAPANG